MPYIHSNGIKYDYKKDGNANCEFHGVVISVWANQKEEEPSFRTFANRAEMDDDGDKNCVRHLKIVLLIHFKI